MRWKGFGDEENTWEPEENLQCPELIEAYNKNPGAHKKPKKTPRKEGFERGLSPEKILGATNATGELEFLIKWKGSDEVDMVPSTTAHVKCPQLVIKFYEARLNFKTAE